MVIIRVPCRPAVRAGQCEQRVDGGFLGRVADVSGTPAFCFFINGHRHHGTYDIDHLSRAVRAGGARAELAAS